MTAPLLSHPHNHGEALRRLERPISPRDVKWALDYMQSNLDAPITMADIVAASGVPGRTLFKHFKDWKGVSPMRHLRNARFNRVRQALLTAGSDRTVTEIAMNLGFTHMSRFSARDPHRPEAFKGRISPYVVRTDIDNPLLTRPLGQPR